MEMARAYETSFLEYVDTIVHPPQVLTQYTVIFDFRSLPMPFTCIAELRRTLLDRVSSCSSAIAVSVPLHQGIDGLAHVLSQRENVFAALRKLPLEDRVAAYFGLRKSNGDIDESYSALMTGLISYVDDGIYFPMLLCDILIAHGKRLAEQYGKSAPKVGKVSYQAIAEADLIPDPVNYPDFEKHFRPKPPAPSLRQRLLAHIGTMRI